VLMASLVERSSQREVTQIVRTTQPRPIAKLIDSARLDRFDDIWVGARDKILWQFHRSTDGSDDVPGTIHDDLSVSRLYAIAIDRDGMTWVKKLNRELLLSADSSDAPIAKSPAATAITCSDDLLALLLDDH